MVSRPEATAQEDLTMGVGRRVARVSLSMCVTCEGRVGPQMCLTEVCEESQGGALLWK